MFGCLWGEQLVRQFGWEWRQVVFDDGSVFFGVVSEDRSLAIYPLYFMLGCMQDPGADVTECSCSTCWWLGNVPAMQRCSYTDVMDGVHRIVPRD